MVVSSVALGGLAGVIMPPVRRRLHGLSWTAQWGVTLLTLLGVTVVGTALACGVLALLDHRDARSIADCVRRDLWVNALIAGPIGIAVTLYESQRARLDTLTLELRTKELENLKARLAERYGPAATLEVAPSDRGVQVSVSLPRRG